MKRRIGLKIFSTLAVLLALLAAVAWFFPEQILTLDSGPVKADAIVLLGGGGADRPERAAALFKEGAAPRVICSGFGTAAAIKALLVRAGVPAKDILLDAKSHTTRENAKLSIPMLRALGATRVIIVTSWFHSRRALACFNYYAPDIQFYSRPSYFGYVGMVEGDDQRTEDAAQKAEWKRVRGYAYWEYVKLLGYWMCYGVCPF